MSHTSMLCMVKVVTALPVRVVILLKNQLYTKVAKNHEIMSSWRAPHSKQMPFEKKDLLLSPSVQCI